MSSSEMNRRRDKRLELALPVQFFQGDGGELSMSEGVTRNVSSGGVYFESAAGSVEDDGELSLRIGVRSTDDGDRPNLTLMGSGAVRRVRKLGSEEVAGTWPKAHLDQGIYGIAIQFQQRPTVQLQSFEELLWEGTKE